jgi:hypothetical protein
MATGGAGNKNKNRRPTNSLSATLRAALFAFPSSRNPSPPSMTKILLIAATIFSLGAAVLGFLNRGKLAEVRKQEMAELSSQKDTLTASLNESKAELEKVTAALEEDKAKIAAAEQAKADAEVTLQAAQDKIAELEQQSTAPPVPAPSAETADVSAITAERDELRTVVASLEDRASSLQAQIAQLQRKEQDRRGSVMRQGLQGTVLAVNQSWNFVVLSLGDRQGVVPNAEMLVQRGGQLLGRVRVTSVEPSTSIADILVRTVPRGLSVMPGDTVIYQAQRD